MEIEEKGCGHLHESASTAAVQLVAVDQLLLGQAHQLPCVDKVGHFVKDKRLIPLVIACWPSTLPVTLKAQQEPHIPFNYSSSVFKTDSRIKDSQKVSKTFLN